MRGFCVLAAAQKKGDQRRRGGVKKRNFSRDFEGKERAIYPITHLAFSQGFLSMFLGSSIYISLGLCYSPFFLSVFLSPLL